MAVLLILQIEQYPIITLTIELVKQLNLASSFVTIMGSDTPHCKLVTPASAVRMEWNTINMAKLQILIVILHAAEIHHKRVEGGFEIVYLTWVSTLLEYNQPFLLLEEKKVYRSIKCLKVCKHGKQI